MYEKQVIRETINLLENNKNNYVDDIREAISIIDNELIPKFEEEMKEIKDYLRGEGNKIDDKNLDKLEKQGTSQNLRQIRRTYRDAIAYKNNSNFVTDNMDQSTSVIFLYKGARILREANNKLDLDDELGKRVSKKATELKRHVDNISKNIPNDEFNELIKTARSKSNEFMNKTHYTDSDNVLYIKGLLDTVSHYVEKYTDNDMYNRIFKAFIKYHFKIEIQHLISKLAPEKGLDLRSQLNDRQEKEYINILRKYNLRSFDELLEIIKNKLPNFNREKTSIIYGTEFSMGQYIFLKNLDKAQEGEKRVILDNIDDFYEKYEPGKYELFDIRLNQDKKFFEVYNKLYNEIRFKLNNIKQDLSEDKIMNNKEYIYNIIYTTLDVLRFITAYPLGTGENRMAVDIELKRILENDVVDIIKHMDELEKMMDIT